MGFCTSRETNVTPRRANLIPKSSAIDHCVFLTSESHADIQLHYKFQRVLGHGQYGTVREATLIGFDRRVAIKSISKEKARNDLVLLKRELEVTRMLDHPNLIKYYEAYEDQRYLHLVMELCTGGDLLERLITMGSIAEVQVRIIMKKLILAVSYLHQMRICHRDLKPENFLFVGKEITSELKVIDFGMSIKPLDVGEMTSFVGTPYYLAPEVISGTYGLECDVWSLGVVMFLLLCGEQPFASSSMSDILRKVKNGEYQFVSPAWSLVSPLAKDLVSRMLTVDVHKRIVLREALNHSWFKSDSAPDLPLAVLDSIKRYKMPKKLQKEVMRIMIRFLSTADIEDLKYIFIEIDRDHSGFITVSDLETAMMTAGLATQLDEVKSTCHIEISRSLGAESLGLIRYTDFIVATLDRKNLMDEELIFLTFQHFDVDCDGFINVADLKTALEVSGSETTTEDLEEMISEWDLDNNRQIDFLEFKRMVEALHEPNSSNSVRKSSSKSAPRSFAKITAPLD